MEICAIVVRSCMLHPLTLLLSLCRHYFSLVLIPALFLKYLASKLCSTICTLLKSNSDVTSSLCLLLLLSSLISALGNQNVRQLFHTPSFHLNPLTIADSSVEKPQISHPLSSPASQSSLQVHPPAQPRPSSTYVFRFHNFPSHMSSNSTT